VEAVLPGTSADSVVIIVHYDSVGIAGHEKENPAVDDDGTGVAMQMEAGRLLSRIKERTNTVRFVAADYEELTGKLEGDVAYVKYLQKEASEKHFKILAASDNDQSGWSCWDENPALCGKNPPPARSSFQLITCSTKNKTYDYPELLHGIMDVVTKYTTMKPDTRCDGDGDTDYYPFWQAGIPAYLVAESGDNPHFDETGHDTFETINMQYFFELAQIQITYQAVLMGIAR
jgi:Zn-dependent M28 family amino/carboxypeptidase